MRARVVARAYAAATNPQRSDHGIEQRHDSRGGDHEDQRAILQRGVPGKQADVVAGVPAQRRRVGNAEMGRCGGHDGVTPPIAGAKGEQRTEHDAQQRGAGEQCASRHRFDDLEVTEATRHLHGADRPVHDEQIAAEPGDGNEEDQSLQQPRQIAGRDDRVAARKAAVPRPLGGFDGQPPPADQRRHQQSGADQVQRAPAVTRHTVTPSRRAPTASLRPRRDTPRGPWGWSPRSASPAPAACSTRAAAPIPRET